MSYEEEDIDYNALNNQEEEEQTQQEQNKQEQGESAQQEQNGENNGENEDNGENKNQDEENGNQEVNNSNNQEQNQEGNDNQNGEEQQHDQDQEAMEGEDQEQLETAEVDKRSVYVQNVDYQSTKDDIIEHFKDVGEIHRVTILKDRYTGAPIGGCYIEFKTDESVEYAKVLSDSMLRGRQIKVSNKRTNIHNFGGKQRGRGRGGRRGAPKGYAPMFMRGNYFLPYRGGRGRGRGGFRPY